MEKGFEKSHSRRKEAPRGRRQGNPACARRWCQGCRHFPTGRAPRPRAAGSCTRPPLNERPRAWAGWRTTPARPHVNLGPKRGEAEAMLRVLVQTARSIRVIEQQGATADLQNAGGRRTILSLGTELKRLSGEVSPFF